MKKLLFSLWILTGLGVGFFGASLLWPRETRPERIMWLFTHYCIPPYSQDLEARLDEALVRLSPWIGSTRWADPVSNSIFHIERNACGISTSTPFALSYEEAGEFRDLLSAFVANHFPELTYDAESVVGDAEFARFWSHDKGERWIRSIAYPHQGDTSGSVVNFVLPYDIW